jgi:hypothetical protein
MRNEVVKIMQCMIFNKAKLQLNRSYEIKQ